MQRLGRSSVFKACEFAGRSTEAPSGRKLSPKVTEGASGRLSYSFEQSIDRHQNVSIFWCIVLTYEIFLELYGVRTVGEIGSFCLSRSLQIRQFIVSFD